MTTSPLKAVWSVLAASLVLAASGCHSGGKRPEAPLHGGPLAKGLAGLTEGHGGSMSIPALNPRRPQGTFTVSDLLPDLLHDPVQITSITLARPRNVIQVGAYVIPNGDGEIGISADFPPDGLAHEPHRAAAWNRRVRARGAVLRPGTEYDLVVGVRLTAGASKGSSPYAIIDYICNGQNYRTGTTLALSIAAPRKD